MEFEWDAAKSEATFDTRGFDFAYASRIFLGSRIETIDERLDYGEIGIVAIGQVGMDILAVICTVRGAKLRIISARRASRKERALWLSRG